MLLASLVFGVVMSIVKGNGAGVRSDVGNLSAPWLLLPFLAAAVSSDGRLGRAMAIGGASSALGLVGFYVANSFVLDLGPHPWLIDLRLALHSSLYWLRLGLVSGPVMGLLGGLWRRTGSRLVAIAVSALLIGEPLAEASLRNHAIGTFAVAGSKPQVLLGEALVGLAVCGWVALRPRARVPRVEG
jgi:Family of unknown function (DUF6518)